MKSGTRSRQHCPKLALLNCPEASIEPRNDWQLRLQRPVMAGVWRLRCGDGDWCELRGGDVDQWVGTEWVGTHIGPHRANHSQLLNSGVPVPKAKREGTKHGASPRQAPHIRPNSPLACHAQRRWGWMPTAVHLRMPLAALMGSVQSIAGVLHPGVGVKGMLTGASGEPRARLWWVSSAGVPTVHDSESAAHTVALSLMGREGQVGQGLLGQVGRVTGSR